MMGLFLLSTIVFTKERILVQEVIDIESEYLIKTLSNPVKSK